MKPRGGTGTRKVRARLTLLFGMLLAASLASGSLAASSRASAIAIQFTSKKPGTETAMTLRIRFTKPGDPNAKPSPIRRLQIDAPTGTVFHTSKVPACRASDAEVMALGPGACPSASRIGDGTITVITGFGEPFDPFVSPTPVFNDGRGWLEVSQTPSTPAITVAVTRLAVSGSRISGDIGQAPGGPPDGQSAVSNVELGFPASTGYVTTPPTCPANGKWVTTGTFTFGDGTTEVVQGDTPCVAPATVPGGRDRARPRISLSGVPRGCTSRGFTARMLIVDASPLSRADVHLDGRRLQRTKRKRFAVRIRAERLRPGRHRLAVTATDAAGNRASVSAPFARCSGRSVPRFAG